MDSAEKEKKGCVELRYWHAATLVVFGLCLVVGAFYFGVIVGRIQEGEYRDLALRQREDALSGREGIPLTFYEELEKSGHALSVSEGAAKPTPLAGKPGSGEAAGKRDQEKTQAPPKDQELQKAGERRAAPSGLFVQVASFQDKAKAESVANNLKKKGLSVRIRSADLKEKGVWYRVELGPFTSEEDAQRAKAKMRETNPSPSQGPT